MYFVAYERDTGRLLQVSESEITNTAAEMTSVNEPLPDLKAVFWNVDTKRFQLKESTMSKLDFLKRFNIEERIRCRTLLETDPIVADIFHLLDEADGFVDLKDPETIAGIQYLRMINVLSEARAASILGE